MPRPKTTLQPRYGQLTVLEDYMEFKRRLVIVRCDCGKEKVVYAFALRNGSTTSCGSHDCKYSAVEPPTHYTPRGTQAIPREKLQRVWERIGQGHSRKAIADDFAVPYSTLCHIVRTIKRFGSVEAYLKVVDKNPT